MAALPAERRRGPDPERESDPLKPHPRALDQRPRRLALLRPVGAGRRDDRGELQIKEYILNKLSSRLPMFIGPGPSERLRRAQGQFGMPFLQVGESWA